MLAPSLLVALSAFAPQDGPPPSPSLAVVPSPLSVQPRFAPFAIPQALRVVAAEPNLGPLATRLARQLSAVLDRDVTVAAPPSKSGDIVLTLGYLLDAVAGHPEGHSIEVFADHVAVSGATEAGVARGTAKLIQMLERGDGEREWSLPAVRIDDAPALDWRALEIEGETVDVEVLRWAVELAHLAGFNGVVAAQLETLDGPEGGRARLDVLGAARECGVHVVLGDEPLPPLRSSGGPGEGARPPERCTSEAQLRASLEAGRRPIDASSLRVTDPFDEAGQQAVYAWVPLRLPGPRDGARPSSSVIGVHLRVTKGGLRRGAGVLLAAPFASEVAWGKHAAPADRKVFTERAAAFAARARLLLGTCPGTSESGD